MTEKRRGLGKGLGALIPSAPPSAPTQGRPIDVFFADNERAGADGPSLPVGSATPRVRDTSAASARAMVDASTAAAAGKNRAGGRSAAGRAARATTAKAARGSATPVASEAPGATDVSDEVGALPAGGADADAPVPAAPGSGSADEATRPAESQAPATDPAVDDELESDDGGLQAVPGASFAEIPVDDIVANRRQPRQVFDEEDLEELASSIREVGVLQPIVVRAIADGESDGTAGYELIMGERRWRASRLAGNETVPAIIRHTEDTDLLRDALLENLHRAQLNPLEEAAAYSQLLEDFDCTHDELAARIARSRPQISNTLRLLKLPPLVQRRVAAGVLTAGHARALLGLSDSAAMERLAQRIVSEGLSVRTTEEIVALGDEPVQPEMRRRPRAGAYSAELNDLSGRLADRFDTRVKVALGQRKGRINIEFASVEDLNRILELLAPDEPGLKAQPEAG